MKTRGTLVGVFAGVMSVGAGFANASCVTKPSVLFLEEGQSAFVEAVCEEPLATLNFGIHDVANDIWHTTGGQQPVDSDPNEPIRYYLPSAVRNQIGEYFVYVKGILADGSIVTSPLKTWIKVLDDPNTTITTTPDPLPTQDPVPPPDDSIIIDPNCPTVSKVTEIVTDMPNSPFKETYYRVAPSDIYAFKFKTPDGTVPTAQRVVSATVPDSDMSKLVQISDCPGGPLVKPLCMAFGGEISNLDIYTNLPAYESSVCVLEAGKTYYANIISKEKITDTTYNCGDATAPDTSTSRCAFLLNTQ